MGDGYKLKNKISNVQKGAETEENMEQKKLCRSNSNKMIAGVCGGIAEYINLDPTIVRLLWAVFCFAGGTGVLAYIVAAIIMPNQ